MQRYEAMRDTFFGPRRRWSYGTIAAGRFVFVVFRWGIIPIHLNRSDSPCLPKNHEPTQPAVPENHTIRPKITTLSSV